MFGELMNSNPGCLGQTGKILSWLVALTFVITLPLAVMLRAGSAILFTPERLASSFQQGLLANGTLRQAVVRNLLSSIPEVEDEMLAALTADLSAADWQRISEIAVPDDWLEGQIDHLTNSIISWLDEDEVLPDLSLNVEPVKRRLLGQDSQQIVEIIVNSWPECSLEEALAFEEAFRQGADLPFSACRLPEPFMNVVIARITEEFQAQVRSMPLTVDLMDDSDQQAIAEVLNAKSQLRQLRFFTRWSLLVPAALLGLLMALSVRSVWDWARWWGIPLFLGGALTLVLTLAAADALPGWLMGFSQAVDLPAGFAFSIQTVFGELGDRLIRRSAIWGAVLGGGGALLLMISLFLPKPQAASLPLSNNRRRG